MRLPAIFLVGLLVAKAGAQTPLQLVRTIPLPGGGGRIDHLVVDAPSHWLFMAALGNDTVEVVNFKTGQRLQAISGCREPQGLVFLPKQKQLFVANGSSDDLKIFAGEKFQLLKTIGPLPDADNVRFDATQDRVYVGYDSGALGVIDANGFQLASIPLDGHPESFQLEKNGDRIFVNVPGERAVTTMDRTSRKVVGKWNPKTAHSNFPMALGEANRRLFIGCRAPARLAVLDTTSGQVVAQVKIGGDTDDVFFDAKRQRLYISCGEGFLDVIQCGAGDQYERIARQTTRGGARTCFFSPESDRLFLAVPNRWGQDAEIRIYQPKKNMNWRARKKSVRRSAPAKIQKPFNQTNFIQNPCACAPVCGQRPATSAVTSAVLCCRLNPVNPFGVG